MNIIARLLLASACCLSFQVGAYAQKMDGKPIRTWWLAGPVSIQRDSSMPPDIGLQEKFFNSDTISAITLIEGKPGAGFTVNGKPLAWVRHQSSHDIVDFDSVYKKADYATAYAVTEIRADSSHQAFLSIGSDDAIKIWLNGQVVYKNWTARAITPDNDLVPLKLVKGSNQLMIKVQDIAGGWGFTARFLDKEGLSVMLAKASALGNLDDIKQLLAGGALANKKQTGVNAPVVNAKLKGRDEVVKLLLEHGAENIEPGKPETLLDQLYDTLNGKPNPGVAVLVSKDGKILYKKGFGYADIEKKIPVTADTKFRIGSITKQFTAAGIMKLQEQGKIQVTDKLSTFIPGFPRGEEVSVYHLLTHTSGIHSYTNTDSFVIRVVKKTSNEELLGLIKTLPYDFNPGQRFSYNNSGYFLLGYIIEKLSGKTLDQFFKETFFAPLQMNNTGMYASTLKLENEAKGYQNEGKRYIPSMNWDMSWAAGAGALYSTVEDLYKWNEAVFAGKVLSEKNLKAAFTPVTLSNGQKAETPYGYGWVMNTYRGQEIIEHSGGLHGFISQMARYPEENMTVVMLTNVSPPQIDINSNRLAEFYLWPRMEKQKSYSSMALEGSIDPLPYVGRYDFNTTGVMDITSEDGKLFAQLNDQPKLQIYPSAPNEFYWKVVEAKMIFKRNEKGEVVAADFEQGSFRVNAPKIREEKIIHVDPRLYREYAGKYQLNINTVITISANNDKLYVRANEEQPFEILPLSENEFLLKQLNARLTFLRDEKGKVNKINVLMAGQNTVAPRLAK